MQINPETGAVVLVNKPISWTSFDVVNKMRYAVIKNLHKYHIDVPAGKRKIKVGHAGTLDPLATGLLIICIGKETKNIETYMADEKEYTGIITLGASTSSYDLETPFDQQFETSHIFEEMIYQTAHNFIGVQQQFPPVFSAIKQDGKRLYESARLGEEIEIKPREIEVKSFEISRIEMPHVHFKIVCSKGTYIRSIAHDFGKKIGSGSHLSQLCRTRSGKYMLSDAYELDALIQEINS
jgi:tRNA pseudouridine55 synthase